MIEMAEGGFAEAPSILAPGRQSDFYFDMKPAMLDPEGSKCLTELVLHELQGTKADRIGGLEMGAVPLDGARPALEQNGKASLCLVPGNTLALTLGPPRLGRVETHQADCLTITPNGVAVRDVERRTNQGDT
jgi:hypothetical protein